MKNLSTKFFEMPGSFTASLLSLATVLLYYFSNNTAHLVLFQFGGVAVSVAICFFAFTFFLKDFVQKKLGTRFAIYNTIFATILVAILYVQSSLVDGSYDFRFLYVLLISAFSAITSETIDSFIFRNVFRKDMTRGAKSSLISNAISVPIDTALFSFLALYIVFGMPASLVISLAIGELIVKYLVSGALAPLIAKTKAGEIWFTRAER